MIKLYKHQESGKKFLIKSKKVILADDPGIGKTFQAIAAVGETVLDGIILVVCQQTGKETWGRMIQEFYPGEITSIITGRKDGPGQINKIEQNKKLWIIINYDIISYHEEWLTVMAKNKAIQTMIMDESHYIKGKSKRAKTSVTLAKLIDRVYCLTGTPMTNRPIELFNQLRAIGHPLGKNRAEYAKRYCGAFNMVQVLNLQTGKKFMIQEGMYYQYYSDRTRFRPLLRFANEQGATNIPELREKLKGWILRRKKDEVTGLPEKIKDIIEVEMNKDERKEYNEAFDAYIEKLKEMGLSEDDIEKVEDAKKLVEGQKLNQVCSYAKAKRVADDAENFVEQDQKVIIFTQYIKTVELLEQYLKEKKIKSVTLQGSTKPLERQKAIDTFQNDESVKVFIGNIQAAGVGITLHAATIVLFADMLWTPEVHKQAEDRAHRYGQKETVNVYYYSCKNTLDQRRLEVLGTKAETIKSIID